MGNTGKRIAKSTKESIQRRIIEGEMTLKEIAEEYQVCYKTVKRYKSELADRAISTADDTKEQTRYKKRERAVTEKIAKEQMLFEDAEEGWTYSVTKTDSRVRESGCWWSFIVYPESAPPHWISKLTSLGNELAISPVHDKDKWEHDSPETIDPLTGEILVESGVRYKKGDPKKAHLHCIIKTQERCGFKEMNGLLQRITNCPCIQKCRSLKGAYEYFIHLNHLDRYQYDRSEIQKFNGFVLEANKYEKNLIYQGILETIVDEGITEMDELVRRYHYEPESVAAFSSRPQVVRDLLQRNWRKAHPDAAKEVNVTISNIQDLVKRSKWK